MPIARSTPNDAELDEITNLGTSEEDPAADENLGDRDDGQEEVTAEPEPSDNRRCSCQDSDSSKAAVITSASPALWSARSWRVQAT